MFLALGDAHAFKVRSSCFHVAAHARSVTVILILECFTAWTLGSRRIVLRVDVHRKCRVQPDRPLVVLAEHPLPPSGVVSQHSHHVNQAQAQAASSADHEAANGARNAVDVFPVISKSHQDDEYKVSLASRYGNLQEAPDETSLSHLQKYST